MPHSVELAQRLGYIVRTGAKSSVGFGDPNNFQRRTSANTTAGAFFVPAVRVMAGCAGRPSGLPVPSDIGSPTLYNPSPVFWRKLMAVPSNQRSRIHEHYPHQPQRCNDPQPDPFARPSRSPVPLALILCRKALPAASHRSHLRRSTAHLWPFLSERQRSYQPPFTRLNPISEVIL